jgi:murein DD-endopeptidase MepM/ murein hydrolase activator NlpD
LSTTIAGGIVVRSAGASELTPETAAIKHLSNTVAGLGLDVRAQALAAAQERPAVATTQVSRELSRAAVASAVSLTDEKTGDVEAAVKKAKADEKQRAEEKARQKAQRWVSPLAGYRLTSGYGWRWGRMHPAQDFAAPVGTPVLSLSTGTVVFSGWSNQGYGYMVQVRYWDGTVSWFAHNSRLAVSVGDQVSPGQVVAYSGNTGHSTGPHLHLEIHTPQGAAVNPRAWFAQKGINI